MRGSSTQKKEKKKDKATTEIKMNCKRTKDNRHWKIHGDIRDRENRNWKSLNFFQELKITREKNNRNSGKEDSVYA